MIKKKKTVRKVEIEGNFLDMKKTSMKTYNDIILNGEIDKTFSLRCRTK